MSSNPLDRFINALRRSDTPFTLFLLLTTACAFVISLLPSGGAYLINGFGFVAPGHVPQLWRLFTYPILTLGILGLLFDGLALWWFGGSLERAWGTRGYAAFWLAASAICALSMSAGALLLHVPRLWVDSYLPLSAVILAWALLNPEQTIMLYGIIPLKAKYLGLAEVLILFFTHAEPSLLMGFFALGGCAFAVWWVRYFAGSASFTSMGGRRNLSSYPTPPRQDTFFGGTGKPAGNGSRGTGSGPRRPRKILTPLDDKRSWKDWGPLAAYQRYRRRKQFERLLDDE